MRVKELADLAGVTVRTVRYYHQVGLLPVPGVRDGCRDYDLTHVARLIRVRWLAQAGVPLSRVAGMLGSPGVPGQDPQGDDRAAVLTDLNATIVAVEEELEELQAQRERIRQLINAVEQHDELSPLPAAVARFYDEAGCRAGDDRVRRAIRRERDFMELAYYRGEMPLEAEVLYQGLDEARLAESIALFGQVADRYESAAEPGDEEMTQVAGAVVERIRRHLGPAMPQLARSVNIEVIRRAADLYVRLSSDKARRLDRAIADALLNAIEEARNS